ncbi:hypothetical protein PIB30_081736 [Stylosanthes scabra]|uniref:Uncharacterized protein n=1 Tax=Stylosanthes scabra TaxID=79078 RepID=A0ABU6TTR0_9FABA|nr:hypothetical protein [Stylosanthes scabra]
MLDEVLACLYVEGAQWIQHPDGRPHFLRRTDLQPMAKGEDIQVDEIIDEQMYKFVNKTNIRSKLPFPSVISLLCKEAKASIPGDTLIPQEVPICGKTMGRVRGPREPRQNPPREQKIEEEAPQQQQQHQSF